MKTSVCIATFNGEEYIKEQLESILLQLSPNDEVIVSDDNSTDNTISIIKNLNDPRVKIFFNKPNNLTILHAKISKNFENALTHCSGDIIFLSDQDDIWLKDKVSKTKKALKKAILTTSDGYILSNKKTKTDSSIYKKRTPKTGFLQKIFRIRYYGCTIAFRKELLKVATPIPNKVISHDAWIGLTAELTDNVSHSSEKLMQYRIHLSNTSINTKNSIFFKIKYRLDFFIALYRRYKELNPKGSFFDFVRKLNKKNNSNG